ncbi:hypothetical protein [Massilia sp. YIM B04103]|uniref:hypothetical protein n=1 Tax=Massilia sp. YIM B04103 TaxID=2963106 RepID=UPI002109FD9D|nr:hypothetical protein [Massilia sp. YIM B04103]
MDAVAVTPDSASTALSESFLDWWFTPWLLAGIDTPVPAEAGSAALAVRLAYRPWCATAGVRAALPAAFDCAWQQLAVRDGALLRRAALLYGGLLAAREGMHEALTALPLAARRWCLATAAIQPLTAQRPPTGACETDALNELALLLEQGFPGMWDRLRLLLPAGMAPDADAAPADVAQAGGAALRRRLRCWNLCLQGARQLPSQGDR